MATELVLAVVLWTFPVALVAGYYAAGYHLQRIAASGTADRYPRYIRRAVEAHKRHNPHRFEDELWGDE